MSTYKVEAGDTGYSIAQKSNMSFAQLEALNAGVDWNNFQIGCVLHISSSNGTHPSPSHGGGGNMLTGDPLTDSGTNGDSTVRHYSGPASNFPSPSQWQKYSLMWSSAARIMSQPHQSGSSNTPAQNTLITNAIHTVAHESGVDRRIILAVIMQESHGDVHVGGTTSADGIGNPGLMQSNRGVSFNPRDEAGSILQMIRDGTTGTKFGDGIKQCMQQNGGNVYEALRSYNSGPNALHKEDLGNTSFQGREYGVQSYVSDVANRLMGAQPN